MAVSKLSLHQIRKAKPAEKKYKLSDGGGLQLVVSKTGVKSFIIAYRFKNKQKNITVGKFPDFTLLEAREKLSEVKRMLADNIDPSENKKREKIESVVNSFKEVGEKWHKKAKIKWSDEHADRVLRLLQNDVFKLIGDMQISKIKTKDIIFVIEKMQSERNVGDTAQRAKNYIVRIFDYAIQCDLINSNPASSLKDIVSLPAVQNRKMLDLKLLPKFLFDLDKYTQIDFRKKKITELALKAIVFTFVRLNAIRTVERHEVDLKNKIWTIPASKTKMKRGDFIVPLSEYIASVFAAAIKLSAGCKYIFAGVKDLDSMMSENTLTSAVRKQLKYDATAHGFRSVASTILHESNKFNSLIIEGQLEHKDKNEVRNVYNKAEYIAERTELMKWYSDHLLSLKAKFESDYSSNNQ